MNTGGWIFMIGSLTSVMWLLIFCYSRVLRKPSPPNNNDQTRDDDSQEKDT